MSPAAPIEPAKKRLPESSTAGEFSPERANPRRFGDLRGVQWRIDLGILPSSFNSVDDLRRVTANCRRSYAALRRRLLTNPQIPKDGSNFPDLVIDNPLSQNPDSTWGRFFHKAELERMVHQDLSRLYPEHGSYFQTPGCQGVLRRILLLWSIRHPSYGYRQGMHELLAPLLYVLQSDLERLSEVRRKYQDYFIDNFDGFDINETDSTYKSGSENQKDEIKANQLDPKIQTIISFSDAYGAEGELGIVLSEKFMEHDAYSMFDALMNGDGGAVSMANFFSHSPPLGGGLAPVLEASSSLYHLLSIVDLSIYTHLVELGVEPQYFALRWLRVLFGREFTLENLLVIWDEIFALDNHRINVENDLDGVLKSSRGAFISAFAVSMILYLRSSLLATENATSCLQRLLNFPEDVNVVKLINRAKSLMNVAIEAMDSVPQSSKQSRVRGHSVSCDLSSPRGLSYWEEKWRALNKEEAERRKANSQKFIHNRIKSWSEKVKMRLSRTESARFLSKVNHNKNLLDEKLATEDESIKRFSSVNGRSETNLSLFFDSLSPSVSTTTTTTTNNNNNNLNFYDDNDNASMPEKVASPESLREEKVEGGKFQWLWMVGKNGPEGSLESESIKKDGESSSSRTRTEDVDQNNMSLKDVARSMVEQIEVIESVFEQENIVMRKNKVDMATKALKKLRKISDILSEL